MQTAPSACTNVQANSTSALINAVLLQPVAVGIAADGSTFQNYGSGVITANSDCEIGINHAVLVTGFGTDPSSGLDYWTVKNSWSTDWGENGYARIERSTANACGVLLAPNYPILSKH